MLEKVEAVEKSFINSFYQDYTNQGDQLSPTPSKFIKLQQNQWMLPEMKHSSTILCYLLKTQ